MGKLADVIATGNRAKCRTMEVFMALDADGMADMTKALQDETVTSSAISAALKKVYGVIIGHNTLDRHREQLCWCYKEGDNG